MRECAKIGCSRQIGDALLYCEEHRLFSVADTADVADALKKAHDARDALAADLTVAIELLRAYAVTDCNEDGFTDHPRAVADFLRRMDRG